MKARINSGITAGCTALLLLSPAHAGAQAVALVHSQLHNYVSAPTAMARQSGPWSAGATWGGTVPGPGARVAIPAGVTVTVDREIQTAYDWVRVDGTLRFQPDVTTALIADTIVAHGRLEMGTTAVPIRADVRSSLIIRSSGAPIDHTRDPLELTRGLIAMTPVSLNGATKREISALATLPPAGATSLQLEADPTGWRVGDEVLVAPTLYGQDEVVTVTSIGGRTVGISPALKHTRTNVPEPGLKVHVGNLTRNVLVATDPAHAGNKKLQGHVMLMGGGHHIAHAAFNDLGRTLSHTPVTDPILLPDGSRNPQLMPLCTSGYPGGDEENVRGRYSLHVHNPGPATPLSIFEGVVVRVQRNRGFKVGIQNHSAYLAVRRAIVHQIDGSGIMTEEGDERGEIRESLIVHSFGSNSNHPEFPRDQCTKTNYWDLHTQRRTDFGHKGTGIWLQGGQVDVVGNILAGHDNSGVELFTEPIGFAPTLYEPKFPPRLLREGDWWLRQGKWGNEYDPDKPEWQLRIDVPPILVADNVMYAIGGLRRYPIKAALHLQTGLQLDKWNPRPKNLFARNTAWNVVKCIDASYSGWGALTDQVCIAGNIALGDFNYQGMERMGVNTHRQAGMHWDYTRVRIDGFTEPFVPSDASTFKDVTVDSKAFVPMRYGVLIEVCGDGIDNNGDGRIDEGCPGVPTQAPASPTAPRNIRIIQ